MRSTRKTEFCTYPSLGRIGLSWFVLGSLVFRTNQRNSDEGTDLQALNAEPRMCLRVHADEEAK